MFEKIRRAAAVLTAFSCVMTLACQDAQAAGMDLAGGQIKQAMFDTNQASGISLGQLYPFSAQDTKTGLYYFTTSAKKSYYQVKAMLTAGTSCHIEIYDGTGAVMAVQADLADGVFERFFLEPSAEYYLRVTGEEAAKGNIIVSEIADDYADTLEGAAAISFNREYSVATECSADQDFLKFTTDDKDATYTLNIDPAYGGAGEYVLLDEEGNLVGEYSGITDGEELLSKKVVLEHKKTYYLKISSAEVSRQVVVSVQQSINKYKITYHLDGGKNHKDNKTSYTATQNISLKNPTKKGYLFAGWYTASDFKEKITSVKGSAKRNYDLYVKWTKATPEKVSVKSFTSTAAGRAKLSFGSISGAKGYQVSLTRRADGKVKNQIVQKTAVAYSGLVQGKKYSIKVRAYTIDSCGNRVYGAYSETKVVTVKKKVVKKTKKKSKKKK